MSHQGWRSRGVRATATLTPLVLAFTALALVPSAGAPDAAALHTWYGTVVKVRDGDTVEVDITGDGTSKPVPIRNAGIQAMSTARGSYSGIDECHSREATARLANLSLRKRVRTQAYTTTRVAKDRFLRYVDVYNPATRQYDIDVQKVLLREGHALSRPESLEPSRNVDYHTYAQEGQATRHNLYDDDYCRVGPAQSVPIQMWINWDADGDDVTNVNGEWVRIMNRGTTALPLAGFYLRKDRRVTNFSLPSSLTIQPGQVMTVHAGTGTSVGLEQYWGSATPLFPAVSRPLEPGSSIYLFDADGDIRALAMYPCTVGCSDPNIGRLALTDVVHDAPGDDAVTFGAEDGEQATVTNTSNSPVNLTSYVLTTSTNTLEFPPGFQLAAGQSVVVHIGHGAARTDASSTRHLYWNQDHEVLADTAGWLELRAWNGFRLGCAQWGTGSCPAPG